LQRLDICSERGFPKVDIAIKVGASLSRRTVGHQRSNRIKGCLECVSGKKHTGNENEKAKN
jgi:hypothetical protein